MHDAYEKGIKTDLEIRQNPTIIDMPVIDNLDDAFVASEKEKAPNLDFWDSHSHLCDSFAYDEVPADAKPEVEDLLYDFRHTFTNDDRPEQFRRGIQIPEIKIERLPDSHPKKHKLRNISDKKLHHLKKHIDTMLEQGVI